MAGLIDLTHRLDFMEPFMLPINVIKDLRQYHPDPAGGSGEADLHLPNSSVSLQPGESHEFVFGERRFVLDRPAEACWSVALFAHPLPDPPPVDPPEALEHTRFATTNGQDHLEVDLGGGSIPLLVKFVKGGVTILPSDGATLTFMVPLFLRIYFPKFIETPVFQGPCRLLSKAWTGNNLAGSEAREWRTILHWDVPTTPVSNTEWDLACCTVNIVNASEKPLKFDRLTLSLESSPIFAGRDRLWAGLIKVRDHGGARGAEVTQTGLPPSGAGEVRQVYPARVPSNGGSVLSLGLGSLVGGLGMRI
jgi:hypothetical protein